MRINKIVDKDTINKINSKLDGSIPQEYIINYTTVYYKITSDVEDYVIGETDKFPVDSNKLSDIIHRINMHTVARPKFSIKDIDKLDDTTFILSHDYNDKEGIHNFVCIYFRVNEMLPLSTSDIVNFSVSTIKLRKIKELQDILSKLDKIQLNKLFNLIKDEDYMDAFKDIVLGSHPDYKGKPIRSNSMELWDKSLNNKNFSDRVKKCFGKSKFSEGDPVKWFDPEDQRVYRGVVDHAYSDGTAQIILESEDIVTVNQSDLESD